MWIQKQIQLNAKPRGFHLITDEIIRNMPELHQIEVGVANLFLQHTSAALCLNENADPSVRDDFEQVFNQLVPEDEPYYTHIYEGSDDLPAHIKSSMLGVSLMLPITQGRFNLGTWQGIYLCEHRNRGGARRLIVTLQGLS